MDDRRPTRPTKSFWGSVVPRVLPKILQNCWPYIWSVFGRSSVDSSFFGPRCARETYDVYWSGRGGSVLVGLWSVVGRFSFKPSFSVLLRSPDRSIGSTGLGDVCIFILFLPSPFHCLQASLGLAFAFYFFHVYLRFCNF